MLLRALALGRRIRAHDVDQHGALLQNEEKHICQALDSLRVVGATTQPEVIVVDGGSTDTTTDLVEACPDAQVLRARGGRGAQLNTGANSASKPWLLFLHADCTLPPDYFSQLRLSVVPKKLTRWERWRRKQHTPLWGCFESISTGDKGMRLVQWGVRVRTMTFGSPYGDQGLLCYKQTFLEVCAMLVLCFLAFTRIISARLEEVVMTHTLTSVVSPP